MASRRRPELSWLSVYPVREELATGKWEAGANTESTRAVYVNIGGGIGHQCAEFKDKYADVPGRVVLQDLAHSIAKAQSAPGVENMIHDFFDEQPVKGKLNWSLSLLDLIQIAVLQHSIYLSPLVFLRTIM